MDIGAYQIGGAEIGAYSFTSGALTVGLAQEADTSLSLAGSTKELVVGVPEETTSAFSLAAISTVSVGLATEADSAFLVQPADSPIPVDLSVETDAALAVLADKAYDVGLPASTASSFSIVPLRSLDALEVIEDDTAFSVIVGLSPIANLAIETDSALAVAASKTLLLAQILESDIAQNVASGGAIFVGQPEETDSAFPVVFFKTRVLGQSIEITSAQGAQARKAYPALGLSSEADSAFAVSSSLVVVTQDLGWEDDDVPWGGQELGSKDFVPVVLSGTGFKVLGFDAENPLDALLERRAVVHVPGWIVLGTYVWPQILGPVGETIQIYLGSHDTPDGAVTWEGPQNFVIGVDEFADFAISGRYLAIKFESDAVPIWSLQSYKIDYEPVGKH